MHYLTKEIIWARLVEKIIELFTKNNVTGTLGFLSSFLLQMKKVRGQTRKTIGAIQKNFVENDKGLSLRILGHCEIFKEQSNQLNLRRSGE